MIEEEFNENKIINMSKESFKHFIKEKIKTAAFNYLRKLQEKHSKIRDIVYTKLEIQQYMVSPVFLDEEVNILHSLRSRAVDCKANYRNMYKDDDMLCILCKTEYCDQKHILACSVLLNALQTMETSRSKIIYEDIFNEDTSKQKEVTALYRTLLDIRKKKIQDLLEEQSPSTPTEVLRGSIISQPCIVYSSLGK